MARTVVHAFVTAGMTILLAMACMELGRGFQGLVFAQEPTSNPALSTDPASLEKLVDRINRLELDVDRLKKNDPAANSLAESQVIVLLDFAYIGSFYQGHTRYLALQVTIANRTRQAFTIKRDQVITEIDGDKYLLKDLPKQLVNYSIPTPNQPTPISQIKRPAEWTVPAEGQAGIWLIYADLPLGASVPKCRIKIPTGDVVKEIDVNQIQSAKLGLDVKKIGPRQCLALLTINGVLNSFNAGFLVDELDKLVEQKIARVVITWGEGSTPPDPQLNQWLQNTAAGNVGAQNQIPAFPAIPSAIREFHVTEYAASEDPQTRNSAAYALRATPQPRVHKTSNESVAAALRTAYLSLPRDELLNEIRAGHPLTRAAALVYGGGRLDKEHLPQIFELAEDKDPEIQKAALQSLCHFGEPVAIEKLIFYARKNIEPLSSSAMESLAASRFGVAHDALLNLLQNEPAASKKKIVQILAKYPRPIWSDALYEFVTNPSKGMDVDSLKALIQVGHAQLVDVLESALKSSDKLIRDVSFQELAKRSDERSEKLAVENALRLLESGPPDTTVVQLLSRTKEPRAVSLLLKQLDAKNDRSNTISLLLQIGDQTVADQLVKKYGSMTTTEKVQVLQGLKVFRHPQFRELCGDGILSNDNQLITAAANALTQDGTADGEKLLIVALDKQKNSPFFRNITNALANFGTVSARASLIKIRQAVDPKKRDEVNQALALLSQRSPGYQFFFQGWSHEEKNEHKEAQEAYDIAVDLDPNLPEAFLGRGKLFLKLEQYSMARKDFEKVLELNYETKEGAFTEFVTSLAITRIVDGNVEEGIKYLESYRTETIQKMKDKQVKCLFHYNAACAYSRAIEQVGKNTDHVDREMLRQKYRTQLFEDLSESIKLGFDDYAHMAKDPDFRSLHEDPEFMKILSNKTQDKTDPNPKIESTETPEKKP